MSTANIHKRMQIGVIFLLIITTVNGCGYEEDTKPIVSGGNPPIIEFSGTGALMQLFVLGPYTFDQLKESHKITSGGNILTAEKQKQRHAIFGDKNYTLWQLDPNPGQHFNVSTLSITYGKKPEGFRQVYPSDGKPEPLIEGQFYSVVGPSYNANSKSRCFTIKNNKAEMVTDKELSN